MITLTSLANEFILGIISYLSFRDLVNLSKTCRSLRIVTYPALYQSIKFDLAAEIIQLQSPTSDAITSMSKLNVLLSILVRRSDLADVVKTIEANPAFPKVAHITDVQLKFYNGVLEDLHLPTIPLETKCATRASRDPLPMLAIAICHRLENLTLALGTCCFEDWPVEFAKATLVHRSNSLARLRLNRSAVRPKWIHEVLQHTVCIETLEYDIVTDFSLDDSNLVLQILDLKELRIGLDWVRSTLRHLVLRYEDKSRTCEDIGSIGRHYLGSLRNLTGLVSLETSLAMLFGAHSMRTAQPPHLAVVLPAQLHRLTITDDFWGFDAFSHTEGVTTMAIFKRFFTGEHLMEGCTTKQEPKTVQWVKKGERGWLDATPVLREFVFDIRKRGWVSYNYWCEANPCQELRHMCESQGIHCTILQSDDDD